MAPDDLLVEAGSAILLHQLEKLQKNIPNAADEKEPEAIHDVRVASRRLRSWLKIMEETAYQPKKTRKFRRGLRGLANSLGQARDAEVFREHLKKYRSANSLLEVKSFEPLEKIIKDRHKQGLKAFIKVVESPKTIHLVEKLDDFLENPAEHSRKPPKDSNEMVPSRVNHLMASSILRRYEGMQAYIPYLPGSVLVLHRLRVAIKHFRYNLEFFQGALPPSAASLITRLVTAQDLLGEIHDYEVARQILEELKEDSSSSNPEMEAYSLSRVEERDRLLQEFNSYWPLLKGPGFKKQLLALFEDPA